VQELRKIGFNAYYAWSLKGLYFCLRAGYYFLDHGFGYEDIVSPLNIWLSGNAKIIQLWHGLGIKKIGIHDSKSFLNNWLYTIYELCQSPANYNINKYMVSPKSYAGIFASAFKIPDKKVIVAGLPRNDVFIKSFNSGLSSPISHKIHQMKNKSKILFYFPTFRDHGGNPFDDRIIDLVKFDRFLQENNYFLIVKLHPHDKSTVNLKIWQRILFLPQNFDLYQILPLGDLLITDYSGIFLDFLLTDKPMIFFSYDLKEFLNVNRNLYVDYQSFVPGPIASNFEELLCYIEQSIPEQGEDFKEKRENLKKAVFSKESVSSSDTIARWIFKKEKLN
jgi:CDP-glycerol glycerophosphotransferase (TagB/SpsB family)